MYDTQQQQQMVQSIPQLQSSLPEISQQQGVLSNSNLQQQQQQQNLGVANLNQNLSLDQRMVQRPQVIQQSQPMQDQVITSIPVNQIQDQLMQHQQQGIVPSSQGMILSSQTVNNIQQQHGSVTAGLSDRRIQL